MRLDRAWILGVIPHQGRMCLLDEVMDWSSERIRCRSATHREADHPLRAHGRLGIACGIEYAAQAMAVHGALLAGAGPALAAGSPPRPPAAGFLASARGVRLHAVRLDDVPGDLICDVARIAGDGASALYEFELRSTAALLLSGRATVVLDAGERLQP
jgi:predicted hotdog family 3-hydroxylacyl-ACP dehydratase